MKKALRVVAVLGAILFLLEITGCGGGGPVTPPTEPETPEPETPSGHAWTKTWGAIGWDEGWGVAVDVSGNVYMTGRFASTVDFDPGSGVDKHTSNGGHDIFLSKFDSSGNFLCAKTWGGECEGDKGYGVAVDSSGNVYVTGEFDGTVDFDPGSGVDEHNGDYDIFLSKFDSSGNFLWAKTWGASGWDEGWGVAVDVSGAVYVTGTFDFTVDFDPGPGEDCHDTYGGDIFLSKFDSSGNLVWAKTWADSWGNFTACYGCGCGVTVDNSGNVYVTGYFEPFFDETADFDPGPGEDWHTGNGGEDAFLSKFDSSGNFLWAKTWGGSVDDRGNDVAVDTSGNVYVTGYGEDAFLSKFDSSGTFLSTKTWGGIVDDGGNDVAVDTSGNVYVTGSFGGTVNFDPGPGEDWHASNGYIDAFLSKFDSSGTFLWAKTWGGIEWVYGNDVAVDTSGNVYVTGYFGWDVDFDPGPGEDWHTANDEGDVFVSKFAAAGGSSAQFYFPVGYPNGAGYTHQAPNGQGWMDYYPYYPGPGYHLGDDWNAIDGDDYGDPVYAIAPGTVIYAKDTGTLWGKVIMIRHDNVNGTGTITSMYAHLKDMYIWSGPVVSGEIIGTVGTANGQLPSHLHFEIRYGLSTELGLGLVPSQLEQGQHGPQGQVDPTWFINTY